MNPRRFLYLGLLIAALIVAACGPEATPSPPTDTPEPTAITTEEPTPVPSETEGPQWDEAEAQLAQSVRLLEEGQSRLEAARTSPGTPSAATAGISPPRGRTGVRPPRSGRPAA